MKKYTHEKHKHLAEVHQWHEIGELTYLENSEYFYSTRDTIVNVHAFVDYFTNGVVCEILWEGGKYNNYVYFDLDGSFVGCGGVELVVLEGGLLG